MGSKFVDITGMTFNYLTVVGIGPKKHGRRDTQWICECRCGTTTVAESHELKSGHKKSCGCYNLKKIKERNTKHGYAQRENCHPDYSVWRGMINRCHGYSKMSKAYKDRGIKVCDRWRESFGDFIQDLGCRPSPEHTLDRIDVNGNYTPENCRWATNQEQAYNKTNTRIIEFNGKSMNILEWSKETSIPTEVISSRVDKRWSPQKILTTPVRKQAVHIEYQGETKTLGEWIKYLNLPENRTRSRYRRGWPTDKLFAAHSFGRWNPHTN